MGFMNAIMRTVPETMMAPICISPGSRSVSMKRGRKIVKILIPIALVKIKVGSPARILFF